MHDVVDHLPIDALASLSRLMRRGGGPGRTRDDHLAIAAQLLALLAQARKAEELAAKNQRAELHFVAVSESAHHTEPTLRHLTALAEKSGVKPISTVADGGHPFDVLLAVAQDWEADLIVMGRSDNRRPGVPYVGSQTEHLLEFTHIPVLVVPYPPQLTAAPSPADMARR